MNIQTKIFNIFAKKSCNSTEAILELAKALRESNERILNLEEKIKGLEAKFFPVHNK